MISFTENGIRIGEQEIPFYYGTFHYWRSRQEDWEEILKQIMGMGFSIVETYIPWRVHEAQQGQFTFGLLDAFLSLCDRIGIYVVVRPGPHINAEMDCFGYPDWVVKDTGMTAKTPDGSEVVYPYATRPYAIPSYASSRFYGAVRNYFMAMKGHLQAHVWPRGRIIAIQAENETCNFFRDNPFIMDYSEESRKQFTAYLRDKFKSAGHMNELLGIGCSSFEDAGAPSGLTEDNYALCREWVCYKEEQILYALRTVTGFIREMDLGIPVFHNCAYQTYTPISVQRDEALEGLSLAGMDAYPDPGDTVMLKERIRYLAGSSALAFVPEFGSGSYFDRGMVLTAREEEFSYLYAFMNGMKAVGFYMLVERNRWTGCPVRQNGTIRRDYYDMFRDLMTFLLKERIFEDRRKPRVLLLKNYDMGRTKALSYSAGYSMLSSNAFVAGPDIDPELFAAEPPEALKKDPEKDMRFEKWLNRIAGELDRRHIDYDYSDRYISPEKLAGYNVVFASMYPSIEEAYLQLLDGWSSQPGKQLYIGPYVPDMDEYRRKISFAAEYELIGEETGFPDLSPCNCSDYNYECREEGIEICAHQTEDGKRHHLYIANVSGAQRSFSMGIPESCAVRSMWRGNFRMQDSSHIRVSIAPCTVQVYEISEEDKTEAPLNGGSV